MSTAEDFPQLVAQTEQYLIGVIAHHTKLAPGDVRTGTPLERLGVQSIMMLQITHDLQKVLGPLSKTLFFEHPTIRDLAAHLAEAKRGELCSMLGIPDLPAESSEIPLDQGDTQDAGSNAVRAAEERPDAGRRRNPNADDDPQDAEVSDGSGSRPRPDRERKGQHRGRSTARLALLRRHAADAPARTAPDAPVREAVAGEPDRSREGREGQRRAPERDIAIIGMAGRYPHASDLDEYWNNLVASRDCVDEVPERRWNHDLLYDPQKPKAGRTYCRAGGFLDDIEHFDPMFFRISPGEASVLDPQERLFLQNSWHVLEDAGYPPSSLAGARVGVFVGMMTSQYQLLNTRRFGGWMNGGGIYASVANRVSHFYDFHGPSLTLDSMCSSSLTALHLACRAIHDGDADLAIAGGVNIMVHPAKYLTWSQYGFLSPSGHCHAFGERADGYVPGEGVGALLVKPLDRALADGDNIRAVVRGTAVNQTGRTRAYYVPGPDAQAEVLRQALTTAGVEPADVGYIEAHGTGTALGDPIEVTGLLKAYGDAASRPEIVLGSVKASIGHLESAAGVASVTKAVLQLEHDLIVPSLHAQPPTPHIDFDEAGVSVPTRMRSWPQREGAGRLAAVSAFGAGGSNAHVVLGAAPPRELQPVPTAVPVVLISAQDDERLSCMVNAWLAWLDGPAEEPAQGGAVRDVVAELLGVPSVEIDGGEALTDLGLDDFQLSACHRLLSMRSGHVPPPHRFRTLTLDHLEEMIGAARDASSSEVLPPFAEIAYTSQLGREALDSRLAIVATDVAGLRERLSEVASGAVPLGVHCGDATAEGDAIAGSLPADLRRQWIVGLAREGRWNEISRLWVHGLDVDWQMLWSSGGVRPRRTRIPSYRFRQDVCWITPAGPDDRLCPDSHLADMVEDDTLRPAAETTTPGKRAQEDDLRPPSENTEEVFGLIVRSIHAVLDVPPERLHRGTRFENLGVDSVRLTQLTAELARHFGRLPATLLFDHQDLRSLERHLKSLGVRSPAPLEEREEGDSRGGANAPARPAARLSDPTGPPAAGGDVDLDGIAVIGLAGRYPGAPDLESFTARLATGDDCITEVPEERWNWRDYPDVACRWGGFIEGATAFDATFFGVAPSMAAYMDPQERLFIQTAWHCLEDAGYSPASLAAGGNDDGRASVGVFVGASYNDYPLYGAAALREGKQVVLDSQMYSVANRVSYLLNLGGPSMVVDTACSSSLHAIHLAAQALRTGECEMAIAGGVNLSLHPSKYLNLETFGFLAADGRCHSFGNGGSGYVPAEGVGAVLLKPLARAYADGDNIQAVIKGSAVAHGGRTHGFTVPNPVAQAAVVARALRRAQVDPGSIGYVEAHGTGTELGDPVEIDALSKVFGPSVPDGHRCPIGSVKSVIGHAEAAAGIAQLTKVIAQMQRGEIFPHRLNSDGLNANIDWDTVPFRVPRALEPWTQPTSSYGGELPRRAGISSFGVGGVSVHVVLEEPPARLGGDVTEGTPEIVMLSAESDEQLDQQIRELRSVLVGGRNASLSIGDIALTLRTGRAHLPFRAACVASDIGELVDQLGDLREGRPVARAARGQASYGSGSSAARPARDCDLVDIARDWVFGKVVLGDEWREGGPARRVSLPLYPFRRKTYWLYDARVRPDSATESVTDGGTEREPDEVTVVPDPTVPNPASVDEDTDPEGRARVRTLVDDLDAVPTSERHAVMLDFVRGHFSRALGFGPEDVIDVTRGLYDLGLDSITANTIYMNFQSDLGFDLDTQIFFNYPSLNAVAGHLLERVDEMGIALLHAAVGSSSSDPEVAQPNSDDGFDLDALAEVLDETASDQPMSPGTDDGLDHLTEEDLARMLADELEAIDTTKQG